MTLSYCCCVEAVLCTFFLLSKQILSTAKVHFETSMPLQLFKGQFGVAFKIKMVEGVMVAKNSTFKYSASLQGMSTNGASSGSIKPKVKLLLQNESSTQFLEEC